MPSTKSAAWLLALALVLPSAAQAQDDDATDDATGPATTEATETEPAEEAADEAAGVEASTDGSGPETSRPAAEEEEAAEENEAEENEAAEEEEAPAPTTCAGAARHRALDAVVRVRSGSRWGAGFVYHSPRHVVTAFDLVRLGRDVTVVTRDGTRHAARVLGHRQGYDLVVLELDEPIEDAEPLQPAPETSTEIGADVVAMGHPFAGVSQRLGDRGMGLLRWSVSRGQIAAATDAGIQADVALTQGHAGGPLLDCRGRVIGLITGAGILSSDIGLIARIGVADDIIEEADGPSDFLGDLRPRLGLGGALHIDESGRIAAGAHLTLGAILFDRVSWMNRIGFFKGGRDSAAGDVLEVDRQLIRIESLLGYRFFVDVFGFTTLYIVPGIGVSVIHDRLSERTASVEPTCMPTMGTSCITTTRTIDEAWFARPAAGLTFLLGGNLAIGYVFEFDVDALQSFHTLRVGLLL